MRTVKANRSVLTFFVLCIITCGIYGLFFIYDYASDVNEMCKDDGKHTTGLIATCLLSIITCGIYGIVWWYLVSNRVGYAYERKFSKKDFNGDTFILWYILGAFVCFICSFVAYSKLFTCSNAVAAQHNQVVDAVRNAQQYNGNNFIGG